MLSHIHQIRKHGEWFICIQISSSAPDLAVFIIDNRATVRSAAKRFGISKSTVHKDLTERLPRVNPGLYKQVRLLFDINKAERHIRGGLPPAGSIRENNGQRPRKIPRARPLN